jgi:hypothetical protein
METKAEKEAKAQKRAEALLKSMPVTEQEWVHDVKETRREM